MTYEPVSVRADFGHDVNRITLDGNRTEIDACLCWQALAADSSRHSLHYHAKHPLVLLHDEPLFIIRGKDALAINALSRLGPVYGYEQMLREIMQFNGWQAVHKDSVRQPD